MQHSDITHPDRASHGVLSTRYPTNPHDVTGRQQQAPWPRSIRGGPKEGQEKTDTVPSMSVPRLPLKTRCPAMPRLLLAPRRFLLVLLCFGLAMIIVQVVWLKDSTRIHFDPSDPLRLLQRVFHMESSPPCLDPNHTLPYEDVFCLERPNFLPNFKNPCWFDCRDCSIRAGTQLTAPHRAGTRLLCLPYFHLLGVDKCGSTDLFSRLTMHPQILPNNGELNKETMFWGWNRVGHAHARITNSSLTFEYYVSVLFKRPAEKIANQSVDGYHSLVTGDASPMDFWDNLGWRAFPQNEGLSEPSVGTPHALRHLYREGRFILIFRNPTDRLYSDYFFMEYGHTAQEFHRDVIEAIKLMNECRNTSSLWFCLTDMNLYVNLKARVNVGMYSEYLKRWLDVFPASSFLFLKTEDFSRDIAATLRQVFHFLQLDAVSDEDLAGMAVQERKYATLTKKQAGPMMNETRKLLDEFYRPYNLELAGILNDRRFLWEDK